MIFIHFKALIKDTFSCEYFKAVGDHNALLHMSQSSQTANKYPTATISQSKQLKTLWYKTSFKFQMQCMC